MGHAFEAAVNSLRGSASNGDIALSVPIPPPFIPVSPAERKQELSTYYDAKIEEIKAFFKEEGYMVALASFEHLLEYKPKGKFRRDKYTPEIAHEIDQLLVTITSLTKGDMGKKKAAIERHHSSLEWLLCSQINHDVGEDFNVFPDQLREQLLARVEEITGQQPTPQEIASISFSCQSMDILTHYMKWKSRDFENFEQMTGQKLDLEGLKPGKTVGLNHLLPFFREKMPLLSGVRENLQIYARMAKNGEPEIIVTRYGREDKHGPDWNLYAEAIRNADPYIAITKMMDRIQGLCSRIAIVPFNAKDYDLYLSETKYLFKDLSIAKLLKDFSYTQSPLRPEIESLDQMMEVLQTLGDLYSRHFPDPNDDGERRFSAHHLSTIPKLGTTPLFLSGYFKGGANRIYRDVDPQSHPIAIFMRQFRDSSSPELIKAGFENLYRLIHTALCQEGGKDIQILLEQRTAPQAALAHEAALG